MKLVVSATIALASFAYVTQAGIADGLNPEEQSLMDKGATMETYKITEHSGHSI
jgi:hypothetical protein